MKLVRLFTLMGALSLTLGQSIAAPMADEGLELTHTQLAENELAVDFAGCTAQDRSTVIYQGNFQFAADVAKCGRAAWGSSTATTHCVQRLYPSLSDSCASCFGGLVACSASECYAECAQNDTNQACITCAKTKCIPKVARCAGVSVSEIPARRLN